mgnify:CR=1 FL=1
MLTYHTLSEFFAAADAAHCAPGELACRQEAEESGKSFEDVWERMKDMIPIFRQSIQEGLADTAKASSGLVGGDANRLFQGKMPRCIASWRALQQDPAAFCLRYWLRSRKK